MSKVSNDDQRSPPGFVLTAELSRALFDESPIALVLVDGEGQILLANRQLDLLFGYVEGALTGQSVETLLTEEQRAQHRDHRAAFSMQPRSRPMGIGLELTARRRDDSTFPVEISLAPLQDQSNPIVIASVADLTDRNRAAQMERDAEEAQRSLASLQAIGRVVSLHRDLTGATSLGQGSAAIAKTLHQVTDRAVLIEDYEGSLTVLEADPGVEIVGTPSWRNLGEIEHARAFRDSDWLVAVARPDGETLGAVSLFDPTRDADDATTLALEVAATVLAMELYRLRSVAETELRIWSDLASELLEDVDFGRSRRHAAALGYDVDRPHRAALVQSESPPAGGLADIVRRAARILGLSAPLLASRTSGVILLVADDLNWEEFGRLLARERGGSSLRLGIGRFHGPSAIRDSATEAELALRISAGAIARFDELGVSGFLAADADPARLQDLVDEWIGALVVYDAAHRSELVETLSEFLNNQGAIEATSKKLHIHPSTLKYRIRRIREISGRDLRNPDDRFNLELACRAFQTAEILSRLRATPLEE